MMNKILKIISINLVLIIIFFACTIRDECRCRRANSIIAESFSQKERDDDSLVLFTSLGVPNIDSTFKSYMDYRRITNNNSPQYNFINSWGWLDQEGFMRCSGEKDLGIKDDYYLIALGSYYGTEIGTKYRITLDTGKVFYGVLADCKADNHTNFTNQYSVSNCDIVEFIVDTKKLNKIVKYHGSANAYMPLNGNVVDIERINFVWYKV